MAQTVNTWVIRNKTHYMVLPNCPVKAAKVMEKMAKQLYPEALAYAQLNKRNVTMPSYNEAGKLKQREILG